MFAALAGGTARRRTPFSKVKNGGGVKPATVEIADGEFLVVGVDDLSPHAGRPRRRWPRRSRCRTRWSRPTRRSRASAGRRRATSWRPPHDLGRPLHVLVLAAARHRHAHPQPDRSAPARSGVAERATVPIDVSLNGAASQELRADRARRHHRHQPADGRAHRAAQLDQRTSSRTTSRSSSSTTRTSPGATHPLGRTARSCRPWLALLVLEAPDDDSRANSRSSTAAIRSRRCGSPRPRRCRRSTQAWAFGHVHINEGHDKPTEFEKFLVSLREPGRRTPTRSSRACSARGS